MDVEEERSDGVDVKENVFQDCLSPLAMVKALTGIAQS